MSDLRTRIALAIQTGNALELAAQVDQYVAERERAVWRAAENIVHRTLTDASPLGGLVWCTARAPYVVEELRKHARAVKYLPHAEVLISEAEADRISKDGP